MHDMYPQAAPITDRLIMPPQVEEPGLVPMALHSQPEQQHQTRSTNALTAADMEWQLQAACRGMGSENFYSPDGERGPARRLREEAAKAICSRCPVLADCQSFALIREEAYGVWGGQTEDERLSLFKRNIRQNQRTALYSASQK